MIEQKFKNIRYLARFPADYDESLQYPVIVFLHGAGTRGEDINKLKENAFFIDIQKHKYFPFIIIAPLCNQDTWFDMFSELIEFSEFINNQKYTDNDRLYLIGASMGGYATWQLAMSKPELFSAIVPICGGGMYWNAYRLKNIPVWAFHGHDDSIVHVEENINMVEAVNKSGGNAKITIYDDCGHNSWDKTYLNFNVFEWLLLNKKDGAKLEDNQYRTSDFG